LQTYSKKSRDLGKLQGLVKLYKTAKRVPDARQVPVRSARRLTNEQVAKITVEYESGKNLREIGEALSVCRKTVSRHLAQAGIETRNRPLSEKQVDEAVRLYESGQSLARVGERIGATPRTIQLRLRERGVALRDTHGRQK